MAWSPEKFQKHYDSRKRRLIAMAGGACVKCGAIDDLEFHHKDKSTKVANLTNLVRHRWSTVLSELEKCELLCASCHDREHHPGAADHGTTTMYRRGCRCDPCTEAARAYHRAWDARRPKSGKPQGGQRGEDASSGVLTEAQVLEIRRALHEGETNASLGRRYGVNASSISLIKLRKTWIHI